VGVADPVPKHRTTAAHLTYLRHYRHSYPVVFSKTPV
jgi:hypothetical protein